MANSESSTSGDLSRMAARAKRKALRRIREIHAIVIAALAGERPEDDEIWELYAE